MSLKRDNREEIHREVLMDIKERDRDSVATLQKFYFKIVTEENLRTSSYRYYYAKIALEILSDYLGDNDTIANLMNYHASKVKMELSQPIISEKDKTPVRKPKEVSGTPVSKFTKTVNKPGQIRF